MPQKDRPDILDQTLPQELQGLVPAPAPAVNSVANQQENETMPPVENNKVLTPEEIQALATATVQKVLADSNREKAIVETVEKLTTERAKAEATVVDLTSRLAAIEKLNTDNAAALATAKTELSKATQVQVDLKADLDKANKDLAQASIKLGEQAREKALAERLDVVQKSTLSAELKTKLTARAQATVEGGDFVYSLASIKEQISDLVDAVEFGKGTAGAVGTAGTEQGAAGGTAETPKADATQAANTPAPVGANANVTPGIPDAMTQATANALNLAGMLTPAKASINGINLYASNFGSGVSDQ